MFGRCPSINTTTSTMHEYFLRITSIQIIFLIFSAIKSANKFINVLQNFLSHGLLVLVNYVTEQILI